MSRGLLLHVCVSLLLLMRTLAAGRRDQPDSPECWLPVDIRKLMKLMFLNLPRPFFRMSPPSHFPRLGCGRICWWPLSSPRRAFAPASPPLGGESLGQTPRDWSAWTPRPGAWCGRGRRLLAAPRFLQGDTDSLRAEARPTHEVSTGTAPHPPLHPGPRHQSVCFLPPSTRYVRTLSYFYEHPYQTEDSEESFLFNSFHACHDFMELH